MQSNVWLRMVGHRRCPPSIESLVLDRHLPDVGPGRVRRHKGGPSADRQYLEAGRPPVQLGGPALRLDVARECRRLPVSAPRHLALCLIHRPLCPRQIYETGPISAREMSPGSRRRLSEVAAPSTSPTSPSTPRYPFPVSPRYRPSYSTVVSRWAAGLIRASLRTSVTLPSVSEHISQMGNGNCSVSGWLGVLRLLLFNKQEPFRPNLEEVDLLLRVLSRAVL